MKNRYIFIVSIALLTVAGSCFAAEAQIDFSGATRDSLDEQMKALQPQLNKVREKIREIRRKEEDAVRQVETGRGNLTAEDIPGILSWGERELGTLKEQETTLKSRIGKIAGQIRSLSTALAVAASEAASAPQASAAAEEYADVPAHEALPLNRAQVAAANAANRDVEVGARLKKVQDTIATAREQLARLQTLQNRYDANSGMLPEDRLAELRMLQAQKPELERSIRGLVRSEESLKKSRVVEKRPSQEALSQSHGAAATGGPSEGTRSQLRRRVEFSGSVVAGILHREDEQAGEEQPDLAIAHAAFDSCHQGSSRRNAAYVIGGDVVTPLTADGLVVAQFPQSHLSELVVVPSARSERLNARRGTGFNLKGDLKSTDKSKK